MIDSKIILTANGTEVIVDAEDFEYLNRFSWVLGNKNEVFKEFNISGKTIHVPMWKFIVQSENNKKALYKNRNSLDHRKNNIAVVPAYISNHYHKKKIRGNLGKPTSKYKGVSYTATYQGHKKWITDISCKGEKVRKRFMTEKDAAEYYNELAIKFYGEYAYQNIIDESDE